MVREEWDLEITELEHAAQKSQETCLESAQGRAQTISVLWPWDRSKFSSASCGTWHCFYPLHWFRWWEFWHCLEIHPLWTLVGRDSVSFGILHPSYLNGLTRGYRCDGGRYRSTFFQPLITFARSCPLNSECFGWGRTRTANRDAPEVVTTWLRNLGAERVSVWGLFSLLSNIF